VAYGREDTEPVVLAAAARLAAWCAGQAGGMVRLVASGRLAGLGSRSTTQPPRERMICDRLLTIQMAGVHNAVAVVPVQEKRMVRPIVLKIRVNDIGLSVVSVT
jgi:hypothetical protein